MKKNIVVTVFDTWGKQIVHLNVEIMTQYE